MHALAYVLYRRYVSSSLAVFSSLFRSFHSRCTGTNGTIDTIDTKVNTHQTWIAKHSSTEPLTNGRAHCYGVRECIFFILLSHSLSLSLSWFLLPSPLLHLLYIIHRFFPTFALLSKTVWNQLFVSNSFFSCGSNEECWSDSHVRIAYKRWVRTESTASRHFCHYCYLAMRARPAIASDQGAAHILTLSIHKQNDGM